MPSLLGQFFSSIKGSQEDIASKGLVYILQSSGTARDFVGNFVSAHTGIDLGPLSYTSQDTGQGGERPDISAFDESGAERLIIEAKFWSSLTSNQPRAYLNRLGSGSVLLFVCPKLREISLFDEIAARIRAGGIQCETNGGVFNLDGGKRLFLAGWSAILGGLREALNERNERTLVSDIDQLVGFCEVIDRSAFLPVQDSDLSPAIARRISSYADLVDTVLDRLKSECGVSTANLRASAQKYGYIRYFSLGECGYSLEVNTKLWETFADTPFWLSARRIAGDGTWKRSADLDVSLKRAASRAGLRAYESNRTLFVAMEPRRNVPEDQVVDGLVRDFARIAGIIGP